MKHDAGSASEAKCPVHGPTAAIRRIQSRIALDPYASPPRIPPQQKTSHETPGGIKYEKWPDQDHRLMVTITEPVERPVRSTTFQVYEWDNEFVVFHNSAVAKKVDKSDHPDLSVEDVLDKFAAEWFDDSLAEVPREDRIWKSGWP